MQLNISQEKQLMDLLKVIAQGQSSLQVQLAVIGDFSGIQLDHILHNFEPQIIGSLHSKLRAIVNNQKLEAKHLQAINRILHQLQQRMRKELQQKVIREGKKLIKSCRYEEAAEKFKQCLRQSPSFEATLCLDLIQNSTISGNKELQLYQSSNQILEPFKVEEFNLLCIMIQKLKDLEYVLIGGSWMKRVVQFGCKGDDFLTMIELACEFNQPLDKLIEEVYKLCPQGVQKYLSLGIGYLKMNKLNKCFESFRQCSRKIKENQQFLRNCDVSEVQKCQKFIAKDRFYLYLGRAYILNDKMEEAIQAFEKGLKYCKLNMEIWKQILMIFKKKDNYEAEIWDTIESMLAINQDDYEANSHLIDLLYDVGHIDTFHKYIDNILQKKPNKESSYCLVAKAYLKCQNIQKSKENCQKCIQINPYNQHVFNLLGQIFFEENSIKEARQSYIIAMKLNFYNEIVFYNMGILCYNEKRYQWGVKFFEKALSLNFHFSDAYLMLYRCCLKVGDFQIARKYATRLSDYFDNFLGRLCLAHIQFQNGRFNKAEQLFRQVLAQQPNHEESIYKLVLIHLIKSSNDISFLLEANRLVQLLIEHRPHKIEYISLSGYLLLRQRRCNEAFSVLANGLKTGKQYYEIYFHFGCLLSEYRSCIDRYGEQCEELMRVDCQNIQSYLYVSLFYLGHEQYDLFLQNFQKYLVFYKEKMKQDENKGKKQIIQIYRSIIDNLQELRNFYPQSSDLILILGILNRDVGRMNISYQYYRQLFQNSNQEIEMPIFIKFYDENRKYHKHLNYFIFISQFIFVETFVVNQMKGMQFYNYLKQIKPEMIGNIAINLQINKIRYGAVDRGTKIVLLCNLLFDQISENKSILQKLIIKAIRLVQKIRTQQSTELSQKALCIVFLMSVIFNLKVGKFPNNKNWDVLFDLMPWLPQIVSNSQKIYCYKQIELFQKRIKENLVKGIDDVLINDLKKNYLDFLMKKFAWNTFYPFLYHDESIMKQVNQLITQRLNQKQNCQATVSKEKELSNIFMDESESKINEDQFSQQNHSRYSSNIIFQSFQQQFQFKPLSSISEGGLKLSSSQYRTAIHENSNEGGSQMPIMNTLQKKMMKKKILDQRSKSLIIIADRDRSQIQKLNPPKTIFIDDDEEIQ